MSKANNLLHIVDFKTEQIIGVLKEQHYWDDKRQWELKNNVDKLEFTVSDGTKESAKLMQQNLIVKQTRDGTFVSYIITEVEQDTTGRPKKIYALGEHTKLKKATVIKPQTLQASTINQSVDFALEGTEWKRGITEYSGIRTINIKDFTNPLDLLKQIASTFELEIRFRTEIMGSFIVGRYVDVIKKVGRDNGKEFLLGKDVQGIRRIENSQDVVTALVGVGPQNSETGEFLTFEEINNGKLYVGNNDALQRWSKDGKHLFDMYSPQTEDQDMTKQRLKQLTEAELKKRIDSSTSYEVSAVALEKVFGLSHEAVRKGDIVRIKDTGFSPPLFLEARLIAADECDTDPSKDKYIFGNYREIKDTRSPIDRLYAQIMGSLSNKASKELLDILDEKLQENVKETEVIRKESEAAKEIAEQVAEKLKNNTVDIIEGVNPPIENLKDRKTLWQDISKGKPGILKLWKDGKWDPVIPDVESVKKETLAQVNKDIEVTKSELNEKVQEAQKQATGQFNEVKESLQGVSRTISDVQNKQGEIDKKVTKFEQDSNGFKLSIESLTKKDTDISNKLSTVEQTVEGTKKTISDVQQTANDLKKTTTEMEERAGKISEKLASVETQANTLTKKTTEIEKSVDGMKETVTKVESNQNGFDKRVATVEKEAGSIKQNVSSLQEIQTNQGKQLLDAKAGWETTAKSLEGKVEIKQVEDYVGGLGTVNELRDADFKLGQKYWLWNSGNGAVGSVDANLKYKGMNTFSITVTGQTQDRWWGLTNQFIECQVNEEFVASGYFNTDGKTPIDGGASLEIEWWTADKKTRIKTARTNIKVVNNMWVRAVCTDKAPANASFVRWRYYVTRNGRLWCATPMLQRGTIASEFWLHPKDQTDADKMIEDIANRVATKDYNTKVTELERSISATEKGVSIITGKQETFMNETYNAYVKKIESRLEVLDEGILAQILKDGIMTSINMSPGKVTIDAEKLNINADTIVKWLTAKGINADVIKISGDKVTIDKNGITAKMADFFFEDERGQKFSVTPRTNLIPDHDFSHISFTTVNNNFLKIEYSPTWTIMSSPYIEKPVVNNYEPMVNPMRIDLGNWIRFTLFEGVKPGKKYTLSAHFRATTNDNRVNITNKPIMRAVFGKYNGDTPVELGRASKTYDAPSIQTGKIVRYALTFIVPSNYVEGNGYVYIDLFGEGLLNNMQAIAVSGVQLVEGDVPSVYNWDTTHGQLVNGTLPFSTIALGTKDNVIYHNHVNKWNYMNAPLEIISNGEMMALVGTDRAGLSFYPRGGGERRSYIGHIYNNENRFRIESKDPVATTQSIECNGINVCGGYFGANAGSIHYTNGSLGLGWYFHDGRWNYVDFTKMTSRT
ncbi:phage tail spike protein [Bacillus toyonensis]|uniref:phage tail spike protein n=1 Tax=Bacillus toyonensis TaxID=155322 RepID=UPI000CD9F427